MTTVTASAPGRVNLIGEHTDYNDGFVLPLALPLRASVTASARSDARVRVTSRDVADAAREYEIGAEARTGAWIDYVQGVTAALARAGHAVRGFDMTVASEVPLGAGLSSSAALEVAVLRALRELFGLAIDDVEVAKLGQAAERDFVGAPIGIMDPMAASLGDGAALFLDTRTLAWERVPLPEDLELAVIDSGVAHNNAASASGADYATRRAECDRAAALLGVRALRDAGSSDLACLPPLLARRARHVVTENARVLRAIVALRAGDLTQMGELADASHASMRDDFEVSTPEIDRLVTLARAEPGVVGARLTGGGFGGAIVVFARRGHARHAAERAAAAYGVGARVLIPARSLA